MKSVSPKIEGLRSGEGHGQGFNDFGMSPTPKPETLTSKP